MSAPLHAAAGFALALLGWLVPRAVARAGLTSPRAFAVDLAPVLAGWIIGLAATGRPGFAGAVILVLGCGLAIADHTKRLVLREPIVFADGAELSQVFTNPELYLPFLPKGLFYGGGGLLILGALSLIPLEPGLWPFSPWQPFATAVAYCTVVWCLAHPPLLTAQAAWWQRHFPPSDDPAADARRTGPLACLLLYGTIARHERPARQSKATPGTAPSLPALSGPIVVIQSESFFDARRLSPGIAPSLLPSFDALCRDGAAHGHLWVPGWGANTMRSEFAVLTGLDEGAIGFDRYNPYHRFARVPVESLAWRLRRAGYRTVCIHPYSRAFYRRDLVLPNLGFDEYVSIEAFAGAERINGFVSDMALGEKLVERIATTDGKLFLFAMTIENHGPWLSDPADPAELAPGLPQDPEFEPLRRYVASLRNTDRLLGSLAGALQARGGDGTLAFYGDHLPSLPASFDALGFADTRADYLLWSAGGAVTATGDRAVHELPGLILDAAAAQARPYVSSNRTISSSPR